MKNLLNPKLHEKIIIACSAIASVCFLCILVLLIFNLRGVASGIFAVIAGLTTIVGGVTFVSTIELSKNTKFFRAAAITAGALVIAAAITGVIWVLTEQVQLLEGFPLFNFTMLSLTLGCTTMNWGILTLKK